MAPRRRNELRSLGYHRAIANALTSRPEVLDEARARVEAWRTTNEVHARYVAVWSQVLALPIDAICAALVEETERMTAARKSSPFAGALSPRERWKIFRAARS